MLFQELSKLKRSSIMMSIIMMAMGLVMIICPADYTMSLVDALGYTLLIFACVTVLDFISGKKMMIDYVFFTLALVAAILGTAVLVFTNNVVPIIGLIFGILLILIGISDVVNALMYARRSQSKSWWMLLVLSAVQILFGLIILINPWWGEPHMLFQAIGGTLLFTAAVGIVRLTFLWPIKIEQGGN